MVRDAALQMDKGMAAVMPSHWEGHARIAIRNSDDVPEFIEETADGYRLLDNGDE